MKSTKKIFILPSWIDKTAWEGYMDTRKFKKYPDTPFALNLLVGKLTKFNEKGLDIVKILRRSAEAGWSSVYEEYDRYNRGKPALAYNLPPEKPVQPRETVVKSPEIKAIKNKLAVETRRIAKMKSWCNPEERNLIAKLKKELKQAQANASARKVGDLI